MSIRSLIWQRRAAWLAVALGVIGLSQLKLEQDAMLFVVLGIGAVLLYAMLLGMRIRRLRPPGHRENPLWVVALLALLVASFDLASLLPLLSALLVVVALAYYGLRSLAARRDRPLMRTRLRKGAVVLAIGLATGLAVRIMDQRDDQAVDDVVQAVQRYKAARGGYPAALNLLTPDFLPAAVWDHRSIRYYPSWSEGPVLISSKLFRSRTFTFETGTWAYSD